MAAGTVIAAVSSAVSIGKGIHDSIQAKKARESAQKKLDNYKRQELKNPLTGVSVPTAGYEMEKEQVMRSEAEGAQLLAQGGAQSAIGGASALANTSQRSMADISSRLTNAEFRLKEMLAGAEAEKTRMQERREEQDIAGLGAEIAYNRAAGAAGFDRAISGLASGAELIDASTQGRAKRDPFSDDAMTPMSPNYSTQIQTDIPSTNALR